MNAIRRAFLWAMLLVFLTLMTAAMLAPQLQECGVATTSEVVGGQIVYEFHCIGGCPPPEACVQCLFQQNGEYCLQCTCGDQVDLSTQCLATVRGLGTGNVRWDCFRIACHNPTCAELRPGIYPASTPICSCP